jgi:RNA-binding protein 25
VRNSPSSLASFPHPYRPPPLSRLPAAKHSGSADSRRRWRAQRRQVRQREYQDDVRDRQFEEDEIKRLEAESEAFLKKQMAEMAEREAQQKARGLLTEDAPMIKLALDAAPEVKKEDKPEPPPRPKAAFGEGDDEEGDGGPRKAKRILVKLEYDQSAAGRSVDVNEAAEAARRNAKLLEIRNTIPRDKRRLWSTEIEWEAMTPVSPFSLAFLLMVADEVAGDR